MNKKPLILLAVILAATLVMPVFAHMVSHPSGCSKCHTGYPHKVGPSTEAWAACRTKHTSQASDVDRSVHKDVGCKCHAIGHKDKVIVYGPWPTSTTWPPPGKPPSDVYFVYMNTTGKQPPERWGICFNCHFIARSSSQVGAVGPDGKIGIPPESLTQPVHPTEVEQVTPLSTTLITPTMIVVLTIIALATASMFSYLKHRRFK